MGVSTNGEISFGYAFDDGVEFPWDSEECGGDIEYWWREISGYQPPFQVYSENGGYMPGFSKDDPRIVGYYNHRREWEQASPVPIALVNYCSDDCPMYAITVKGVGLSCCRGYPKEFDPSKLVVTPEQIERLKQFCATHNIEVNGEPKWMLTSYWG